MTQQTNVMFICENGHPMASVAPEVEMHFESAQEPSTTWQAEDRDQGLVGRSCSTCGAKILRRPPSSLPGSERWLHAMPWTSDEEREHQIRGA